MFSRLAGVAKGMVVLVVILACASVVAAGDPEDRIAELMEAAFQGNAKTVAKLLDGGVDVNSRYIDNETALIFASLKGHVQVVKLLLARGADVHAKDNKGMTALEYATQRNRVQVMKLLKSHLAQ